jgi:hypothetical protein
LKSTRIHSRKIFKAPSLDYTLFFIVSQIHFAQVSVSLFSFKNEVPPLFEHLRLLALQSDLFLETLVFIAIEKQTHVSPMLRGFFFFLNFFNCLDWLQLNRRQFWREASRRVVSNSIRKCIARHSWLFDLSVHGFWKCLYEFFIDPQEGAKPVLSCSS